MSVSINSIYTSELTNGQLWIGNTANNPTSATLTPGNNIAITNGPGTITVGAIGLGSLNWIPVSTGQVMVPFQGYIIKTSATFILPASPSVGDIYGITSYGAIGGFGITTGTSVIYYNNFAASSTISTTATSATIALMCTSVGGGGLAYTVLFTNGATFT